MTSEDRVLAAAEARVRTGGYNGFSFRDIARDTGLTSAGVHYHFPTKADLVARLAKDYASRFVEALDACPPEVRVRRLRDLFADSLRADGKMCLCGLLAAESGGLPEPVMQSARIFFRDIAVRLSEAFPHDAAPRSKALTVLAQLEGAAVLAIVHADPSVFDEATQDLNRE